MRWNAAGWDLFSGPNSTAGASGVPSNQKGIAKPSRRPPLPACVRTCRYLSTMSLSVHR